MHCGDVVSVVDAVGDYKLRMSANQVLDRRSEEVKREEWKGLVSKMNDFMLLYSTDSYTLTAFDGQEIESYVNEQP